MLRTFWRLPAEIRRLTVENQQLQLDLAAADRARADAEAAARRTAERNLRLARDLEAADLRGALETEDYAVLEGRLHRMVRAVARLRAALAAEELAHGVTAVQLEELADWEAERTELRGQVRELKARAAALDSRLVGLQADTEAAYRAAYDATGGPRFDSDQPFGQLPAIDRPIVADRPSPADLARTAKSTR